MSYIGDFNPGDVFDTKFTTVTASGAPVVFTGSAAVSVYKGNSVTQSTSGVTLTVDFDGMTGSNNVNINTGADGTFYAAGNDFQIVATAGTAGGISLVGYVLKEFSIQHRSPLRPTTASRTLNVASTGQAGVNWADVAAPTTTVSLTNTTMSATQIAASVTDNVGGNVVGSVGSVVGAVGSVTGDVGGVATGGIDAASFAAGAIDAAAIATGAIDADALAADAVVKIWAQAMTELGAVPAANASALAALTFMFMSIRNKRVTTTTSDTISNDAGATIATAAISDSGTVFTKEEYA